MCLLGCTHHETLLPILFDNAVRYAAAHSVFIVHLTQQPGQVVLTLTKQAERPGAEPAERLFDRFYRAEAARRSEGSGLGLAITRRIPELHHSTITAQWNGAQLQFRLVALLLTPNR